MSIPSKNRDFFEIKLDFLKDNTSSHFDVYANLDNTKVTQNQRPSIGTNPDADDLLLYAKAPYSWTHREISDLNSSGISSLYVKEDDRKRFQRYLRINEPAPEVDHSLEARFRIVQVEELGAHLIETSFLAEIDDDLVGKLRGVAGDLSNCLREDPRSVLHLKTLADHDLYTYIHSVGVGSLSTAIAMSLGITDPTELANYAFGGLMHDIGKRDVPLNILNKAGPLNPDEWEHMKRHPDHGTRIVTEFETPQMVVDMISLHHEKLDGSGYPFGLSKNEIPIHVQIATVADIFNALTTTRCYHRKRTRFEALMFMKHHLKGKISAEVFKGLVRCLATEEQVVPPASKVA